MASPRDPSKPEGSAGWKNALAGHFLLAGFWLARAGTLRPVLEQPTRKITLLAASGAALSSMFVALSIVSMVDGVDVVRQLLAGNWLVYSQFLGGPGINTYLVALGVVVIIGFLLPWGLNALFNVARKKMNRQSARAVFTCSVHCVLGTLILAPLIHVVVLIATWQPVMLTQLLSRDVQNGMLSAFLAVLLASLAGWVAASMRMLWFSWPRAIAGPIITLLFVVALVLLFA